MNKKTAVTLLVLLTTVLLPATVTAQSLADDIGSLQSVLDQLYEEMIPMCSQLSAAGRAIAGVAATWYIAARVWRHIAAAEPVDFYPLLRPFAIGIAIMMFPSVISLMNGILNPAVAATAAMVNGEHSAIEQLLKRKEQAIKGNEWQMYASEAGEGDRDAWYRYAHPRAPGGSDEGMMEGISDDIRFAMAKASYSFRDSIKQWMSEVLEVLFQAAALCINTIRTFYLIVLAILGPLVFGLSVFDGFHHTLTAWIARYVNVSLWLPVANIFGSIIGKIQENMLRIDIQQAEETGATFFSAVDTAYLVFLIIGIIGYLTVPSVANYIMHAGGAHALLGKTTTISAAGGGMIADSASRAGSAIGNFGTHVNEGLQGREGKGLSGTVGSGVGYGSSYLSDKLSGSSNAS